MEQFRLGRRIRIALGIFILGLVASGLTAFPLVTEVEWLGRWMGLPDNATANEFTGMPAWIVKVRAALRDVDARYPFLAYGTDWLAFGHLVIAIFFLGPLVRPENNRWVITAGMIACASVPVLALVCGSMRGIPFSWQLIDCSFGVVGFIPLWMAWRDCEKLTALSKREKDGSPDG